MKFLFTSLLVLLFLAVIMIEQKVDAGCPLSPNSCNCAEGTKYKRCTGIICQKCLCITDEDPGPCMFGNGGGGWWIAIGSIFGIGKKK